MFVGYDHEEFSYRLSDPVDKRIIRSHDVIFLEDQIIEDFDKIEKPKYDGRSYTDVVPKPPSGIFFDGGDIQVDDDSETNDQELYHDEQVEEVPPEPPVEPELRRSTRERQVSQRYPPHKYVMIIDN